MIIDSQCKTHLFQSHLLNPQSYELWFRACLSVGRCPTINQFDQCCSSYFTLFHQQTEVTCGKLEYLWLSNCLCWFLRGPFEADKPMVFRNSKAPCLDDLGVPPLWKITSSSSWGCKCLHFDKCRCVRECLIEGWPGSNPLRLIWCVPSKRLHHYGKVPFNG